MITEILNFTSEYKDTEIILKKYNISIAMVVNTHLGEQTADEHIQELKTQFRKNRMNRCSWLLNMFCQKKAKRYSLEKMECIH